MNQMNPEMKTLNVNRSSIIDNSERNEHIYCLYVNGETLQSIGEKYLLTRERVRQIVIRSITKKLKIGIWNGTIKNSEHKRLQELIDKEIKKIRQEQILTRSMSKLQSASNKGIIPEKYTSIHKFAKDVGINHEILEKISPDVSQKVKENMSIGRGGKKWSRFFLRCRLCGTSTIPHQCYGYCKKCLPKTDIFKEIQEASRLRNQHRWKAHQQKYIEGYNDKKYFGGHREAVLKRDNYSCVNCGKSDADCFNEFREHLRIVHLDKKSDQDMNNMVSLCRLCCLRYIRSKRKENIVK